MSNLGPGGTKQILGPGGTQQLVDPGETDSGYNFSTSNLILMIGGQVLLVVLALMVVFFGTAPLTFPANAVRNMISSGSAK